MTCTSFVEEPSCLRTNHIPVGAPLAKPYMTEDAVTIDSKSYSLLTTIPIN